MRTKLFALFAAVALVLAPLGPGIGAAVAADAGNAPLDVSVTQAPDGTVAVAVTANGTAVENASVMVDAPNVNYAGEGNYTTGENGTVGLPAPAEDVTVFVTVTADNRSETTSADLVGADLAVDVTQAEDGTATVTVTDNGSAVENASVTVDAPDTNYTGEGEYTTDENGTVGLPASEENVTIDVTAEADNRTATTTATLATVESGIGEPTGPFGQTMASLVQSLLGSSSSPIGPLIADFAVSNNPGNAPDNAGPPAFLFDDESADNAEDDRRGPPEDAGPPGDSDADDDERGPPEDAGPPADEDTEDDTDDEADEEDADEKEDEEDADEADEDEDEEDGDDRGNGNSGNGNSGNGNSGNGNGPPN